MTGSVAEKVSVPINGVHQGMVIRGKHSANPVLLWVHGGPGMPDYPLTQQYPTDLEDLFTVVWWDQRGAALSYDPDIPPDTMTIEQFIADTIAVTDYLRNGSTRTGSTSWATPGAASSPSKQRQGHRSGTRPTSEWRRWCTSSSPRRPPATTCSPPTENAATPRWCADCKQQQSR